MELTILKPCLNEAETLATCVKKAQSVMDRAGIDGKVLIADNGSTDGSQRIATELGARVVPTDTRGFDRQSILALDLQAPSMEFASEMVVKATIKKLQITEVPTILSPDGRSRPPHLRSWRDGWRHLRFLLLFSPRSLFLYPGFTLFCLGLLSTLILLPKPVVLFGVSFDIHTLIYSSIITVIGLKSILSWVFAKIYAQRKGIVPPDPAFDVTLQRVTLERGLIAGVLVLLVGFPLGVYGLGTWNSQGFGPLSPDATMRIVIPSATGILLGMQLICSSFFLTLLGISASPKKSVPYIPSTFRPDQPNPTFT